MPWDAEAERVALLYMKMVTDYQVEQGLPDSQLDAVRYILATQATELNGDGCRFPACDCPKADCSKRPE